MPGRYVADSRCGSQTARPEAPVEDARSSETSDTKVMPTAIPPAVLRLPNPKGDIDNFVSAYTALYGALSARQDFDIDDGVAALINQRMLSSSGAVGAQALKRSTRADRSRDPLFNQFKMFSELYRLLGWLHATSAKARFRCTMLGRYVASYSGDVQRRLIEESLIGIVLPSSHSQNLGVTNLRPFARLVELMLLLDGEITRDEMILGIYTMADDLEPNLAQSRASLIQELRKTGTYGAVMAALRRAANGRQVNTLRNYTRFMIGAIQGLKWTVEDRRLEPYAASVKFFRLTPLGRQKAEEVGARADIRQAMLVGLSLDARAALCVVGQLGLLSRAGVALTPELRGKASRALSSLPDQLRHHLPADYRAVEFSPYQQADHEALRRAEEA